MRYFSMFSGIGGFELGLQRAYSGLVNQPRKGDTVPIGQEAQYGAGVDNQLPTEYTGDSTERSPQATCIGYSEIDKYAIKVYERHFGNDSNNEYAHIGEKSESEERSQGRKRSTDKHGIQLLSRSKPAALRYRNGGHTNYGDATTINAKELPDFDLLVGGFPCQAFSVAGKRGGFNDTRGTLFFDIARILKEKRPRHLLLENVKGLLSHDKGKTFSTIIGVLSDLGYRVEWQVLNSKDFGVPQNRERVFIVGHLGGECRRQVFPIGGTDEEDTRIIGQDVAYTIDANYHKGTNTLEKSRRSVILHNIYGGFNEGTRVFGDYSPTIRTSRGGGHLPSVAEDWHCDSCRCDLTDKVVNENPEVTDDHCETCTCNRTPKVRRLTPLECERLQGFPDDWTALGIGDVEISDTQRYKMCGNAVTVNVIESIVTNFKCLEPA